MAAKRKTGGRKKGTPNKATASVKAALVEAFDRLGGVEALVRFGEEKPSAFYQLWAKLLPTEVKAEVTGRFVLELAEEIVDAPPAKDRAAPPGPG